MNLTKQIVLCFSCRFGSIVVINNSTGNTVRVFYWVVLSMLAEMVNGIKK